MNKKWLLMAMLALFILNLLNVSVSSVSATPTSPYIAIFPSSNTMRVGYNRTISIRTDYGGNNVSLWHVQLTFNATVLQCTEVINGDLITLDDDPSAMFISDINNIDGEVSVGAYFDTIPPPYLTTNGPGTLCNITFKGLSTGNSNLRLEKDTKVQVYDPAIDPENLITKIAPDRTPDQIGHGSAMVTIPGDANGDRKVNSLDIGTLNAHWSPASGTPPWSLGYSLDVDTNDDGYINSLDIGVVNAHWGQSW